MVSALQRLLPVGGGLNSYQVTPDLLLDEASRQCPFCFRPHPLRRHGHYQRHALVDGSTQARIRVLRLLCPHTGRTVSLLPDFCIPRRQHGPLILGPFLAAYASGQSLLAALRLARPDAPSHSVAQSLLRGFLGRATVIRTYIAGLRARAVEHPPATPGRRSDVQPLLVEICVGFATAAIAFLHHGVGLHAMRQVGLA